MELGLAGRVALIAGGSSGLGLAVAEELAKEGAHVAIGARDPEKLARFGSWSRWMLACGLPNTAASLNRPPALPTTISTGTTSSARACSPTAAAACRAEAACS